MENIFLNYKNILSESGINLTGNKVINYFAIKSTLSCYN